MAENVKPETENGLNRTTVRIPRNKELHRQARRWTSRKDVTGLLPAVVGEVQQGVVGVSEPARKDDVR